jgi:chemotaxis signal transduction protein
VRALLALPHVVGVVELDGSPIWLLDLDLVE